MNRQAIALAVFVVAPLVAAPTALAQDAAALLHKHDCSLCHARDEARTGPAWVEIAQRYRNDPKAATKLAAIVRKGAHGSGPWHMPPLPQVPETDARRMVEYILATAH